MIHDKLTADTFKCLIGSKHDFTVIRGYTSEGKLDPNLLTNIKAAKEAGIKNVDVFVNPCLPCEPEEQVKAVVNALKGQPFGKVWINIDVPGWREFKNSTRCSWRIC